MDIREGGGPVLGPKRSKKALFALNMPKKSKNLKMMYLVGSGYPITILKIMN